MVRTLLILCLNFLWVPLASAFESKPSDELRTLSLEELLGLQSSISTRTEVPIIAAPSSVTVYLRQDIINMGIESLEELLNFIPGVYSNRNDVKGMNAIFRGHYTEECSRGILLLINGVRANDPVCGGAFEQYSFFSLLNVKRVEVIRGPGSAIYGSNALIGVVNVVTQDTGNQVTAKGGSLEKRELGLKYSQSFGKIDTSFFAHYSEDEGYFYEPFYTSFGEYVPTKDPRKSFDFNGRFKMGNAILDTSLLYQNNSEFINSGGGLGNLKGKQRAIYLVTNIHLRIDWQFGDDVKITTAAGYSNTKNDYRFTIIPAETASQIIWTNGAMVDYIGGNYRKGNQFQVGFDGSWKISDSHIISFGGNFRNEATGRNSFQGNYDNDLYVRGGGVEHNPLPEGENNIGFFGGIFGLPLNLDEYFLIDATSRNVFGSYLQSELNLSQQFKLTSGFRFDTYQEIGSKVSIREGLVYVPTDKTTIKALFGQAFRAPSIFEFKGEALATGAIGNPTLNPETVTTIEFSGSQRIGPVQLSLTWFNNKFKNGIQNVRIEDVVPGIDTFQPQNVGELTTRGWEAEVYIQLSKTLTLRGGISLFDKVDDIGVASTIGFWVINYNLNQWNFNMNGYYRGSILAQKANGTSILNDTTIEAFTHLNAKVNYSLKKNIEIFASAKNIFNESYRNFTIISDLPEGVPMRGRLFMVGLSMVF